MLFRSIGRPVTTGPVEGAAMGNLLVQAMALGDIPDLEGLREVVRNSVEVETYMPNHTPEWERAYEKLCGFLKEGRSFCERGYDQVAGDCQGEDS